MAKLISLQEDYDLKDQTLRSTVKMHLTDSLKVRHCA